MVLTDEKTHRSRGYRQGHHVQRSWEGTGVLCYHTAKEAMKAGADTARRQGRRRDGSSHAVWNFADLPYSGKLINGKGLQFIALRSFFVLWSSLVTRASGLRRKEEGDGDTDDTLTMRSGNK